MEGIVKRWLDRGYGFISVEGNDDDVFVHHSGLEETYELREGQNVEFDLEDSPKGPRAVHVKIVELVGRKVDDENQINEFMNKQPSVDRLELYYLREGESGFLVIKNNFFTTAYSNTIRNIGAYQNKIPDDYVITAENDYGVLSFAHERLAEGSEKDMQEIINIHKNLIEKYSGKEKCLGKNVLDSYESAFKTRKQLILEL